MTAFVKSLPQLILGAAFLAVATILGYTQHFNVTDTFTIILGLTGALGVLAGWKLGSPAPNSELIAHGAFTVLVLAACTVLSLHGIFTSAQILPIFALYGVGGATGLGVGVTAGTDTPTLAAPQPVPEAAVIAPTPRVVQ